MCGIGGIVGPDAPTVGARPFLAPIAHRGELALEALEVGEVAIGTHRLPIRDPEHGRQPFVDADGRFAVVCNGEIYNPDELRRSLPEDRRPRTACDTELVLLGRAAFGPSIVARIRGMYAYAVVDLARRDVELARDPLGIKPLYYAETARSFVFGSELKSLTRRTDVSVVRELPPGATLTCERASERTPLTLRLHSRPSLASFGRGPLPPDAVARTREAFLETVASHLCDDGSSPVACLLSGGIDSSTLVWALRELGREVVAFTFADPSSGSEDLASAALVCRTLGVEHVVVPAAVPDLQAFYVERGVLMTESPEPALVRNAVSYHFLCRAIREAGFRHALSGEGADELFGGYAYFHQFAGEARERAIEASLANVHRTYLQMADRASMAATLEVRVPYLDARFVRHCAELGPAARFDGRRDKAILRALAEGALPPAIVERTKIGMNAGSGLGSNDPGEGIYADAVLRHYRATPRALAHDRALCEARGGFEIATDDLEEVFDFARFFENGFDKLEGSDRRLQLNTTQVRGRRAFASGARARVDATRSEVSSP